MSFCVRLLLFCFHQFKDSDAGVFDFDSIGQFQQTFYNSTTQQVRLWVQSMRAVLLVLS
jgi:hypothetical protein